jgi:phosphate transport system substrate-binding protein
MSRSRLARRLARCAGALAVALMVSSLTPPAYATGPTILGAGSTWSQIAIEQWRVDVNRLGLSVNYQGVGSTTGRQFFAAGTVDFGVSEIPFQSDDPPNHRAFAYLPIVAGGTSLMYNLKTAGGDQIRNLKLSPATIALIFTGKITNWSDSRITADYGSKLSDQSIRLLVRSDGSGTSAQFSAFIAATQPSVWRAFTSACGVPATYTSFWPYGQPNCLPNAVGQKGSDGIANYVSNPGLGVGTIGYLEAGYAVARNFPVVGVKNASGHYAIPTAVAVATALKHAHLNADSTQELGDVYTAPERNAYPMSSYSYMIVPTDGSISADKGAVLGRFIIYFACNGQQAAQRLGYSPLPKELVEFAFNAEKKIPGAPNPPAVDGAHCANPTMNGTFNWDDAGTLTGTCLVAGDCARIPGPGPGPSQSPGQSPGSSPGQSPGSSPGSSPGQSPGSSGTVGSDGFYTVTATPQTIRKGPLATLKLLADQQIAGAQPPGVLPMGVLALFILALVFGPLVLRIRFGRRSEERPPN